jgi:hypothetical protein
MAFIPVPTAAEVVIESTLLGQPVINVLNFKLNAGGNYTTATLTSLANIFLITFPATMGANFSDQLDLVEVRATDLSSASGPVVSLSPATPAYGVLTSPPLPGMVAVVITHRTASRGRSFRGRTYFGGLVEEDVTGNNVVAGRIASLLSNWAAVLSEAEAEGHQFGIVSRYTNNAPRTTGIITPVTSSAFRNTTVDSQRRRSQI